MLRPLIATALIALTVATAAHATPRPKVIKNDLGGMTMDYHNLAQRLAQQGVPVVIDGTCASSCLLFVHEEYGLDVCATPNARLGFHMPFVETRMGRLDRREETIQGTYAVAEVILAGLPDPLQAAFPIDQLPSVYHGARKSEMLWVSGADAQSAIGACN